MRSMRGMTLIDVLVGTALFITVFTVLFGLLRSSTVVSSLAKSRAGATAVGESEMEYIRSLTYDNLGTVGGIPSGVVPQVSTTTDGGVTYVTHVFINYVDDPADGLGAADTNGVTTDYKSVRVEVDYTAAGASRSIAFSTFEAPPSIETTTNGGTLSIHAVDSTGASIAGAQVSIVDASVSPAVNLSAFTSNDGTLTFSGATVGTGYQVTVTDTGYSTAKTYDQNAQNVNPNPGHLTVSKDQTTTGTFAIDKLATFSLEGFSPIATTTFRDSFADSSQIGTSSNTTVSGGMVVLAGGALNGSVNSIATTSPYLEKWGQVYATTSIPAGTTLAVHVLDASGNLVPDAVLSGNSAGFTTFPVDVSGLATTTYPSLALSATLTTTATTTTPELLGWSLSSSVGPVPIPNVGFTLTGSKTIGTTGSGSPIYKTAITTTTGSTAVFSASLEWDSYMLTVPNYDIMDGCEVPPYAIAPGTTDSESLILGPHTSNMLLVSVQDATGAYIPGATVTLSNTGYNNTETGSQCGNAYFGGLTSSNSYSLTISKAGYTTQNLTNIPVSGTTVYPVTLN